MEPTLKSHTATSAEEDIAFFLLCFAGACLVIFPFSALGLLGAMTWRKKANPPVWLYAVVVVGSSALLWGIHGALEPGWIWRMFWGSAIAQVVHQFGPVQFSIALLWRGTVELLMGPGLLFVIEVANHVKGDSLAGQLDRQTKAKELREKVVSGERLVPKLKSSAMQHPSGALRLGWDVEKGKHFDINFADLRLHTLISGSTGSGKTTTVFRLMDAALSLSNEQCPAVTVIDCKSGGLGRVAAQLSAAHRVPFQAVSLNGVGYDPCTGDGPTVANKLIGAFNFGPEAEVYKSAVMECIPIVVGALMQAGEPVTLEAIHRALSGSLGSLGRRAGEPYQAKLSSLASAGGVGAAGYMGMARRLGALIEGSFGPIFLRQPSLDWDVALSSKVVTYIPLSATASPEDVRLFGKVIVQDIKQACSRRLDEIKQGYVIRNAVLIIDEFMALDEPSQLIDLLVQCREAQIAIVVCTQSLPDDARLRKSLTAAGILIAHRVEAESAEALAAEFGTKEGLTHTQQMDNLALSGRGTITPANHYEVSPNVLRKLPVGRCAIQDYLGRQSAIVQVYEVPR